MLHTEPTLLRPDLLRYLPGSELPQDPQPDPSQAPTRSRDDVQAPEVGTPDPGPNPEPSGGMSGCFSDPSQIALLVGFVAIFYFLILRPQQKQERQRREMLAAIQKGDRVVTTGGLHGIVESIDDQTVALRVDTIRMVFDRSGIGRVVRSEGGGDAAITG